MEENSFLTPPQAYAASGHLKYPSQTRCQGQVAHSAFSSTRFLKRLSTNVVTDFSDARKLRRRRREEDIQCNVRIAVRRLRPSIGISQQALDLEPLKTNWRTAKQPQKFVLTPHNSNECPAALFSHQFGRQKQNGPLRWCAAADRSIT